MAQYLHVIKYQKKTNSYSNKKQNHSKLYIGLDIHKRSWEIYTATDLFDVKTCSYPPSAESLKKYVDKHFPDHHVVIAFKAGCFGNHPHRCYTSFKWLCLVVNPADISRTGKSIFIRASF